MWSESAAKVSGEVKPFTAIEVLLPLLSQASPLLPIAPLAPIWQVRGLSQDIGHFFACSGEEAECSTNSSSVCKLPSLGQH